MVIFFLLRSSFFRTTSTVASSEAPADYRPAPGRTDSIPERLKGTLYIKHGYPVTTFIVDFKYFVFFFSQPATSDSSPGKWLISESIVEIDLDSDLLLSPRGWHGWKYLNTDWLAHPCMTQGQRSGSGSAQNIWIGTKWCLLCQCSQIVTTMSHIISFFRKENGYFGMIYFTK